MSELDVLADHLAAGRRADALDVGLALWRQTPDPALGTLCARLGALRVHVDGPEDPWADELASPGSVDLDLLVGALLPVTRSAQLAERAALLARRPPDPRIGVALESMLRAVPFTSSSARANLGQVYDTIGRVAEHDPRFAGIAATLDADWDVRPLQKEWMFGRWGRVARGIDARWPEVPRIPGTERLAALIAALDGPGAAPDTVEDLIARVWADPRSSAARAVLRDALLEAGDPRGELMALQASGSDPERQQALIDAHGAEWLGELAPFAKVTEWRDGFPRAAEGAFPQPRDVARVGTHPAWATLEELTLEGHTVGPVLLPFLAHVGRTARALRTSGPHLATLLAGLDLPAVETLDLRVAQAETGRLLGAHRFPALRHLVLDGRCDVVWLQDAGWLGQIETLDLDGAGVGVLTGLWPALVRLERLQRASCARADLTRGPDGAVTALRLSGLELLYDPDRKAGRDLLADALGRLPDGALTSITLDVDAPVGWDASVAELVGRSTRLRTATLRGVLQGFDREGELVLDVPLPALHGSPEDVGFGADGLFVAQDDQLLEVDPRDGRVLSARQVGTVRAIAVGSRELAWLAGGTVTWEGRWTRPGTPRMLRFGPPGLLVTGFGAEIVDRDGTVVACHTVGNQVFHAGDFSPAGDRFALVGWSTRVRVLDLEGSKPKMLGKAKQTLAVAWAPEGLWVGTGDGELLLLDESGAVKAHVGFRAFVLERFDGGVVAVDGEEALVLDPRGREILRVPAWRAWPGPDGLVVVRHDAPWVQTVPWP